MRKVFVTSVLALVASAGAAAGRGAMSALARLRQSSSALSAAGELPTRRKPRHGIGSGAYRCSRALLLWASSALFLPVAANADTLPAATFFSEISFSNGFAFQSASSTTASSLSSSTSGLFTFGGTATTTASTGPSLQAQATAGSNATADAQAMLTYYIEFASLNPTDTSPFMVSVTASASRSGGGSSGLSISTNSLLNGKGITDNVLNFTLPVGGALSNSVNGSFSFHANTIYEIQMDAEADTQFGGTGFAFVDLTSLRLTGSRSSFPMESVTHRPVFPLPSPVPDCPA